MGFLRFPPALRLNRFLSLLSRNLLTLFLRVRCPRCLWLALCWQHKKIWKSYARGRSTQTPRSADRQYVPSIPTSQLA
jgi:hypothetical protein